MFCSKFLFLFFYLILYTFISEAKEIKIGLYNSYVIESIVLSTVEGEYILSGDGKRIAVIRKGSIFFIDFKNSSLSVQDTAYSYGNFKELELKGVSDTNVFQLKPIFPSLKPKESDNNLVIRAGEESIKLINTLNLELYIPGTVESEGGTNALEEFYKAQAVVTRTYALKNFYRHSHEGFNLCDEVHCQAYNGKSRMNKIIYQATSKTENEVLINNNNELVTTAYHSNCGGITADASMVWTNEMKYLSPVHDPFCNNSKLRNWKETIELSKWKKYLQKKGINGDPLKYTLSGNKRVKYLDSDHKKLPLTEIRNDMDFKSSFFNIEISGSSVLFEGHGYGHGVGLCQQGAMEMAKVGYTYIDILMFYFTDLELSGK